jgi:hypothetical protein
VRKDINAGARFLHIYKRYQAPKAEGPLVAARGGIELIVETSHYSPESDDPSKIREVMVFKSVGCVLQ